MPAGGAADNLRYIINIRRRRNTIHLQRVERVTDLSYRAAGAVRSARCLAG